MQHHVLDRGQRQRRMPVKPHGAVPDEARAMAVVAGEVVLRRRFAEPEPVMCAGAGARDAGVVPKRCLEFRPAFRKRQHAAPRLADTRGTLDPVYLDNRDEVGRRSCPVTRRGTGRCLRASP